MPALALAPLSTPEGLMERLFLHETRSPGYGASYNGDEALKAMRLMRQAVENRLKAPKLWGAPGARDEIAIIANKSQFAEFGAYPNIPASFLSQVELILALATTPRTPATPLTPGTFRTRSLPRPKSSSRSSYAGLAWWRGGPPGTARPVATSGR